MNIKECITGGFEERRNKKSMEKATILIIENEEEIRTGIRVFLNNENYHILEANNGPDGLKLLDASVDLVILDTALPGMSGFLICEEIRKLSLAPVLFLTAMAQESDKLVGLMAGGDDYVTKPFSYAELLGRIKALLRRYLVYGGKELGGEPEEKWLEVGEFRLSENFNEVYVGGTERELSEIEYRILLQLMRYPRRILSVQKLYEMVWNEPYVYTCSSTVAVHIGNLRKKVEKDPKNPVHITTVYGKGYRFEA